MISPSASKIRDGDTAQIVRRPGTANEFREQLRARNRKRSMARCQASVACSLGGQEEGFAIRRVNCQRLAAELGSSSSSLFLLQDNERPTTSNFGGQIQCGLKSLVNRVSETDKANAGEAKSKKQSKSVSDVTRDANSRNFGNT